jgi:hypothetical protein
MRLGLDVGGVVEQNIVVPPTAPTAIEEARAAQRRARRLANYEQVWVLTVRVGLAVLLPSNSVLAA